MSGATVVCEPHLSTVKYQNWQLVFSSVNNFLRMGQFALNLNGQFKNNFFAQILEKQKLSEDFFVTFFQQIFPKRRRKMFYEFIFFVDIWLSLHLHWLLYIICDSMWQLRRNYIWSSQIAECFQVSLLKDWIWTNFRNNLTNVVYVVGQKNTTDCLNKNHTQCLRCVHRNDVTKTNCKHNSCRPVIRPNILLKLRLHIYVTKIHPCFILGQFRHWNQYQSQEVSEHVVDQK